MCILWYDTDHFNYELKSKRHAEGHVMGVEQDLYQSATALIEKRYPAGWGGAAALRLASGGPAVAANAKASPARVLLMFVGFNIVVSSIGKVIFENAIYRNRFGSGGHISPCWVVCSSRGLAREFASTANSSMRPLIMFCAA